MLDIIKHIKVDGKEYPVAFTFNVMESVQEKYGSMKEWGEVLQPSSGEPRIKDLKWTMKEFINEGIDIENEEKGEKREFVTEKQVGRLISCIGLSEITSAIQNVTVESMVTNEKNEKTTQMTEADPETEIA
jgi:hypothetical protein